MQRLKKSPLFLKAFDAVWNLNTIALLQTLFRPGGDWVDPKHDWTILFSFEVVLQIMLHARTSQNWFSGEIALLSLSIFKRLYWNVKHTFTLPKPIMSPGTLLFSLSLSLSLSQPDCRDECCLSGPTGRETFSMLWYRLRLLPPPTCLI